MKRARSPSSPPRFVSSDAVCVRGRAARSLRLRGTFGEPDRECGVSRRQVPAGFSLRASGARPAARCAATIANRRPVAIHPPGTACRAPTVRRAGRTDFRIDVSRVGRSARIALEGCLGGTGAGEASAYADASPLPEQARATQPRECTGGRVGARRAVPQRFGGRQDRRPGRGRRRARPGGAEAEASSRRLRPAGQRARIPGERRQMGSKRAVKCRISRGW
jgi:hypothetical protein